MKRSILVFGISIIGGAAQAQCTPDPLYADSVFGVWPDTTENFMSGVVSQFYSDTLNLIVPTNAGDIPVDPPYPAIDLDSVQFLGVDGLPPGLTVVCNSQTPAACTFLPAVLGCGLIEGTPTVSGTFALTLNVRAWYSVIFPLSLDASFPGYEIVISEGNTGVSAIAPVGFGSVRNIPNPFSSRTSIEFQSGRTGEARVRVFNLVGEELWSQVVQLKAGTNRVPFESGDLPAGVYLYKIESGNSTYTGRMALQR